MKKIKSEINFVYGVISGIFMIVCFTVMFIKFEWRFLSAGILLLALSAVNFKKAFSRSGMTEKLSENVDERDVYITMKSSRSTLKILNYVLYTACFAALILYGFFKLQIYITIALTLCAVLVSLFLIMLFVNIYYDKHI